MRELFEKTPALSSSDAPPAAGVTAARGFFASGIHCGIRRSRADLALIVSDRPASAAAVFTTNRVQAAPILVSRQNLSASCGQVQAILVNSGNANACTGEPGLEAARATVAETAKLLGIPPERVLVASTGVIGVPLPLSRLLSGLPDSISALSPEGGDAAAEAILTTDTRAKRSVRTVRSSSGTYTIGGMAKGSGMIHPNMATTLGFVTTDAAVPPVLLQRCLRRAVDLSFHRISVDGDTSTNDMVAVLSGGASGVTIRGAAAIRRFETGLTEVLVELAKQVVRDGEGASKLITVVVESAASDADALQVARTVAGSALVKTAIHGADANWGRIVAATGRAGVAIAPERMRVAFDGVEVFGPGYTSSFSEEEAREVLLRDEVTIRVDLGQGSRSATTWTCDLTPDYVKINASYRS